MKHTTAILTGLVLASGLAFAGDEMTKSFDEVDQNDDGVISQTEVVATLQDQKAGEYFGVADANRDGYLNEAEFQELLDLREEHEEAE
jgi:Ca2+-binding EF-hand superfamily protein